MTISARNLNYLKIGIEAGRHTLVVDEPVEYGGEDFGAEPI